MVYKIRIIGGKKKIIGNLNKKKINLKKFIFTEINNAIKFRGLATTLLRYYNEVKIDKAEIKL